MLLENCEGFDWDDGNTDKNWYLHGVTDVECEEIFYNVPIIINFDERMSSNEDRYIALGRTNADRRLFFSLRL